jgi:hypothetical protein
MLKTTTNNIKVIKTIDKNPFGFIKYFSLNKMKKEGRRKKEDRRAMI